MEQVAMAGRQLDTAEATGLQAPAGLGELRNHALDVLDRQRMRNGPAQVVGSATRPDGVGIAAALMAAAPGILYLPQQATVLRLHRRGPAR